MAIRSFKDRRGPILFDGRCPKGFPPDVVSVVRRKLRALDAAVAVRDLTEPPGNRLEKLRQSRRSMVDPHQRSMADLLHLEGGRST
jgi:toxin HigB-1